MVEALAEGENTISSEEEGSWMKGKLLGLLACGMMIFWLAGCSKPASKDIELKRFPLDTLDGLITRSGVEIDTQAKKEGRGSLWITVTEPSIIRLFEVRDIDIEDAALIYQAKVRTDNAQGNVYLEMWCHFEGKGEFFSRGLQASLTGTTDWTTEEISFFLKKGEKPDYVKINVVSEGPATIWIDDIRLLKRAT
jgi:hypothetical protein